MDIRRIQQVLKYGKRHAKEIAALDSVNKGWFSIFFDILCCYYKYGMWSNQYKKEKFWELSAEKKIEIGHRYKTENTYRNRWVKDYFKDYSFLIKWGNINRERNASQQAKRIRAYKKRFKMGNNCFVGYGVYFQKHHYVDSQLIIGNKCHFAENVIVDYTGGVTFGENVIVAENVKILTHVHNGKDGNSLGKGVVKKPLIIQCNASIGSRSYILPGVSEIGRCAEISAGSVVKRSVPPYAIVIGNPARVVGFKYPLQGIIEYEEDNYQESQRIPVNILEANYKKYYLDKLESIKTFLG